MKIFSSIYFWIFFFLIIRFYGITNPPLEISHNWRQSLTTMVARNFEENPSIMHPAVDMDGGKEVALEFPLFSYLVFLFNKIFGFTHWHGRLVNLLFTSVGMYFFYRIIKRVISESTAFYATIILCVSIFFAFGRKTMPDTFSASLTLAGIFCALEYIKTEIRYKRILLLGLTTLFIALGLLCKIPSITLLGFLLFPLLDKKIEIKIKAGILLAIIISLNIAFWWYDSWNPLLLKNGAYRIIFPLDFFDGFAAFTKHIPGMLEKFYFSALSGYVAFAIFLYGCIWAFIKKENKLLGVFTITLMLFFVFIIKASSFFYFHNYYIIPFVPFMAMMAGFAISSIKKTLLKKSLIILAVAEALLNQQHDLRIPPKMIYKLSLEKIINRYSSPDDKIILNTGPNIQQLYLANRKGWLLDEPAFVQKSFLDSISSNQYSLLVLDRKTNTAFQPAEFKTIYSDENYLLLKPLK